THESLLQASNFVETLESRQGTKIACVEEIAFRQGWIDAATLEQLAAPIAGSAYGKYLIELLSEDPARSGRLAACPLRLGANGTGQAQQRHCDEHQVESDTYQREHDDARQWVACTGTEQERGQPGT